MQLTPVAVCCWTKTSFFPLHLFLNTLTPPLFRVFKNRLFELKLNVVFCFLRKRLMYLKWGKRVFNPRPHRGSAHGPRWGRSFPRTPSIISKPLLRTTLFNVLKDFLHQNFDGEKTHFNDFLFVFWRPEQL